MKITDASAQLSGFTWLYKQKGPPHLKDSGTADAAIHGLSINPQPSTLNPKPSTPNPKPKQTKPKQTQQIKLNPLIPKP